MDELGSSVNKLFAMPHITGAINYAEDDVSEDYAEYTPEEHAARGRRFSTILAHPELGRLIVKHRSAEGDSEVKESLYYVNLAKTQEALKDGLNVVQVFNVDNDSYEELDLRRIKSKSTIRTSTEQRPVSEQPERVANIRLMERVHSDPKLMALGWFLANLGSLGPELAAFINQTLLPVRMTPFGQTPPISLLRAQDAAVTAYVDVTATQNAMPELGRVKYEAISKFIDTLTETNLKMDADATMEEREEILAAKERPKADFGNSTQLRRTLSQACFIYNKVMESGDQELFQQTSRFFRLIGDMENLSPGPRSSLIKQLDDMYAGMRPNILSDIRLLQKSTGMHAPHKLTGYVEQDKELAKTHPETTYVGAAQMKNLQAVLLENRAGLPSEHRKFAKDIAKLMKIFPEFAGALSIIGMVFAALPQAFRDEISSVLREYLEVEDIHSEEDLTGFRRRIRGAYAEHAAIIRERLTRDRTGEMSFAKYLTGMEEPWVDKTDWNNYPVEQALFAIAPEFSKVSEKRVEETKRDMATRVDTVHAGATKFLRAMFGFMKMYPRLSAIVVMLPAMIKHLPKDLAKEMFDDFFDYHNGAWNNAEGRVIGLFHVTC